MAPRESQRQLSASGACKDAAENGEAEAEAPAILRVVLEKHLGGTGLFRHAWPRAEVVVNMDTRMLSVLAGRDLREFPLTDCTLHHSRVARGLLGVRFARQDTQLLFSGTPPSVCRLFREVLAATRGCRRRASGPVERYRHLDGVPPKRQRRDAVAGKTVDPVVALSEGGLGALPAATTALLTREQRAICEAAIEGESLFFTGGAGTGKSFLLQQLLRALGPAGTAVTASTALAASQLGGSTLHKWAGVGRGEGSVLTLARELRKRREALARWRLTRTLVIDEISMVDGEFFAKLEVLARAVRRSDRPFGGLQLVLAGDFLQLPPVSRGDESGGGGARREEGSPQTFCFEVKAWRAVKRTFELTEVFRQKDDAAFCRVLNEIRFGELSEDSAQLLIPRLVAGLGSDVGVMRLMPMRWEVERVNTQALAALPGELVCFEARDQGDPEELDRLSGARRAVELRVGALVVLTRTVDPLRRLVNGSQGQVTAFVGAGSLRQPVVAFRDAGLEIPVTPEAFTARCGAKIQGVRVQLPLELAWAVSVHKSQGMTLGAVEVSLETVFEHGQVYVALSRARSLHGVFLVGDEESLRRSVHAEPRCVAFHRSLGAAAAGEEPSTVPCSQEWCAAATQQGVGRAGG